MYGSWAEELKEQGYEVAMTATDAAQLANSFAIFSPTISCLVLNS